MLLTIYGLNVTLSDLLPLPVCRESIQLVQHRCQPLVCSPGHFAEEVQFRDNMTKLFFYRPAEKLRQGDQVLEADIHVFIGRRGKSDFQLRHFWAGRSVL